MVTALLKKQHTEWDNEVSHATKMAVPVLLYCTEVRRCASSINASSEVSHWIYRTRPYKIEAMGNALEVESVLRKQRTEKYTYKYTRMPKQVMEQRR
jgi:hypothetical protein